MHMHRMGWNWSKTRVNITLLVMDGSPPHHHIHVYICTHTVMPTASYTLEESNTYVRTYIHNVLMFNGWSHGYLTSCLLSRKCCPSTAPVASRWIGRTSASEGREGGNTKTPMPQQ